MRDVLKERMINYKLITLYHDEGGYDVWMTGACTGHYYKGKRYSTLGSANQCFKRYCEQASKN